MTNPQDERKLALAALDADALAKDLLKPTDERVREYTSTLLNLANNVALDRMPDRRRHLREIATLLETLLTENKALREKCRQIEITAEMLADQYNPETHVAVSRAALFRRKTVYPAGLSGVDGWQCILCGKSGEQQNSIYHVRGCAASEQGEG